MRAGRWRPRGPQAPRPPSPRSRGAGGRVFHRPLARRVVALLVHTPITPNQVTLISAVLGVGGGIALCPRSRGPAVVPGRRPAAVSLRHLRLLRRTAGPGQRDLLDHRRDPRRHRRLRRGYRICAWGADYFMVTRLESTLVLAARARREWQYGGAVGLFDHAKTRYIARVGAVATRSERRMSARVTSESRSGTGQKDATVMRSCSGCTSSYSRAQHAALAIPPVAESVCLPGRQCRPHAAVDLPGNRDPLRSRVPGLRCSPSWWAPSAAATSTGCVSLCSTWS